MNTPDKNWWIAQAGEYVLGTLEQPERLAFKKAKEHDENARKLVAQWEQWLQPLADSLTPVEVNARVWAQINARLFSSDTVQPMITSVAEHKATVKSLKNSISRWRSYAGLATAASVLIASLAWMNYQKTADIPPVDPIASVSQFDAISIIRDAESTPLWVVDAALNDGFIRVTAIAPPTIDDTQSYQLWAVKPNDAGVQSMGLIPHELDQSTVVQVATMDEAPVAFAVSLEPLGGSAEAVPSGPVLYQGEFRNINY